MVQELGCIYSINDQWYYIWYIWIIQN